VSRSDGVCRRVVDFFCPALAVAIEINGNSHDRENAYEKDRDYQREIEKLGIQFLRFNDLDVKRNMPGVLSVIEQWIEEHTPDPSQEGNYTLHRSGLSREGNYPPRETEVKKSSQLAGCELRRWPERNQAWGFGVVSIGWPSS